jgi:DNA-binding ferritin-like protein (Dps family)
LNLQIIAHDFATFYECIYGGKENSFDEKFKNKIQKKIFLAKTLHLDNFLN